MGVSKKQGTKYGPKIVGRLSKRLPSQGPPSCRNCQILTGAHMDPLGYPLYAALLPGWSLARPMTTTSPAYRAFPARRARDLGLHDLGPCMVCRFVRLMFSVFLYVSVRT